MRLPKSKQTLSTSDRQRRALFLIGSSLLFLFSQGSPGSIIFSGLDLSGPTEEKGAVEFENKPSSSQRKSNANVEEVGWWTPWINATSRIYPARNGRSPMEWCFPISDLHRQKKLPSDNIIDPIRGLLYVKSHKASSTTCTGINIAIARHIARRNLATSSGRGTTIMTEPTCEHYDTHQFHNDKKYVLRRDPMRSLLWTFVRHPRRRDLSELYHFHVTRRGLNPMVDVNHTLNVLKFLKSKQTKYLSLAHDDTKEIAIKSNKSQETGFLRKISDVIREKIFMQYDFIGITERMAESLAVMTLLWDLEPSDTVVINAKRADGKNYDDGGFQGRCFKLIPPPRKESDMHPHVAAYFRSNASMDNHLDYLLYYAAHASLDRTVEALGVARVQERTKLIQRLQSLAENHCSDSAIFPCSRDGVRQLNLSIPNRYFIDSGCGYPCVDRILGL